MRYRWTPVVLGQERCSLARARILLGVYAISSDTLLVSGHCFDLIDCDILRGPSSTCTVSGDNIKLRNMHTVITINEIK